MRVVLFCHSLLSDWNHGNAHFLRGICTELLARGHQVTVHEPADAWSLANLVAEHGQAPLEGFARAYPQLASHRHDLATLDLDAALDHADLVIVHEWNDHQLVKRIGEHRHAHGGYRLQLGAYRAKVNAERAAEELKGLREKPEVTDEER